jgi:hypothetical protein
MPGGLHEVADDRLAAGGQDRLRVELDALGWLGRVPHPHWDPALGCGGDGQEGGQGLLVDYQRVVAGGLEWLWQAGQEAAAVVGDR